MGETRLPSRAMMQAPTAYACWGQDAVPQSLQAAAPFRKNPPGNGRGIYGIVQPSGTPIIHSIKDGAGICVPDGFAALPDNPYSKPSKYAERLVDFSHDSLERR